MSSLKTVLKYINEDINSVFARDPSARSTIEVILTYPGVHAIIMHRIAHLFWIINLKLISRFISAFSRFVTGIEIHPGAKIGRCFFIDHGMGVVIGETAEIGNNVTLYHGVTLGGVSWSKGKRHPTLEDGVTVGAGAKILGPFTVHKNAKIGSNAVVTKEVPEEATAIGNPARFIFKKATEEKSRKEYAESIGFQAYSAIPNQGDPLIEGVKILLDRMQHQERCLNGLADRLCILDPSSLAANLNQENRLNNKELEFIEKLKKECEESLKNDESAAFIYVI